MCLSAGRGRPARTPFGFLVPALRVVVPASKCAVRCLSLVGSSICWRVGGTRNSPVEALLPQCRKRFELGSSSWSRVLGIDADGGPPHCDFADEGGARMTSGWCPGWWGVTLAGVIVDLVGEVGDQLGSLCQVVAPDRVGMQRVRNAREPGHRTWVDGRELWEAPVEHGGHVAGSAEVSSAGSCQHVAERVLTGVRGEGEQVGSQRRPSRFSGEFGDVLVGLVELCDGLGSEELFRRDVETVTVNRPGTAGPLEW
jgi:hypothetical protein